jgi:hypothetical protein
MKRLKITATKAGRLPLIISGGYIHEGAKI